MLLITINIIDGGHLSDASGRRLRFESGFFR